MNNTSIIERKDYIISALALVASLYIYTVYRTDKIVVNQIIQLFTESLHQTIIDCKFNRYKLPNWVIYSLPEGLWILSVTLISGNISFKIFNKSIQLVYLPIIYAIFLELLQLLQITNGRFDLMDIVVALSFWLFARMYKFNGNKTFVKNENKLQKAAILTSYSLLYLSDVITSNY